MAAGVAIGRAPPGNSRPDSPYFPFPTIVMAGLDPAIHVFSSASKAWMPGTSPSMKD